MTTINKIKKNPFEPSDRIKAPALTAVNTDAFVKLILSILIFQNRIIDPNPVLFYGAADKVRTRLQGLPPNSLPGLPGG